MNLAIGGVGIAALILGIVEAAKAFGVNGKGSQVLAMVLGFLLVGVAQAIANGMIPEDVVPYIELVVVSVTGALASMGYYDLARRLSARA